MHLLFASTIYKGSDKDKAKKIKKAKKQISNITKFKEARGKYLAIMLKIFLNKENKKYVFDFENLTKTVFSQIENINKTINTIQKFINGDLDKRSIMNGLKSVGELALTVALDKADEIATQTAKNALIMLTGGGAIYKGLEAGSSIVSMATGLIFTSNKQ